MDINIKLLIHFGLLCFAVVPDAFLSFTTFYRIEGDDGAFTYNASTLPNVSIHWTKIGDDNFYRAGPKLDFPNISRTDSGNYTCYWNGGKYHNELVDTVYIDVQYPAEVTNFSVGPEYPLEDQTIKVICRVGGNPRPSIRIEANITDIGHEEYSASLHGPNSTLIGTSNVPTRRCGQFTIITCHGENWLKTWTGVEMLHTAYRRQTVFTACPPRGWNRRSRDIITGRGRNVHLWVNMKAYPIPVYVWSRDDGQPLREPGWFNGSRGTLYNLVASDFGNYTMTARNPLGNYTAHWRLINDGHCYGTCSAPSTVAGFITMAIALLSFTIL